MSKKTAMVRVDEELHGRVKRLLEQSKLLSPEVFSEGVARACSLFFS